MAGKPKGDKPKKARGPKPQPSKYDWDALETDYITGDVESIIEFCHLRQLPKDTVYKKAKGWQAKRATYRAQAHKMLRNGWLKDAARDLREKLKINLSVSQGIMKVGVDALIPGQDGTKPLKPKTAAEASKLVELATRIERNTLATMAILEGALKDTPQLPADGGDAQPTANVVIIDIPSNGKEAKELPPA